MPTPLAYGGLLYICSNSGILSGYRIADGERVFQERVAGKGGAFSASPIAARERLYLTSEDGEVHVLKAGPKPETLASNPMGEVLMATPALVDDMIIVRGMKHVFAIREARK
jgi:outer membrane protein assembly factor BamB